MLALDMAEVIGDNGVASWFLRPAQDAETAVSAADIPTNTCDLAANKVSGFSQGFRSPAVLHVKVRTR